MNHAPAIPSADSSVTTRRGWTTPVNRGTEIEDVRLREPLNREFGEDPWTDIDEPKWAAWKVSLGVAMFCGSFWAGVYYILAGVLG
ncbi:MAG: hypothetical protein ACOYMK_02315 [Hyphomonadaceae bacterium]|jgi:hypothetical protein